MEPSDKAGRRAPGSEHMMKASAISGHLSVNGDGENVLDETEELVSLQQVCGGGVLEREVAVHGVREAAAVKDKHCPH